MKQISLRAARTNAGFSQKSAAKRIKVGKQTICNWERGRTKIDANSFLKLCRLYNLSPQDISLPVNF